MQPVASIVVSNGSAFTAAAQLRACGRAADFAAVPLSSYVQAAAFGVPVAHAAVLSLRS